ncbi:hypothetical protein ACFYNL_31655 [Streptomyces sp. NPDC007808]|uniref:hypothetical protein n=1 Tax=Streptomyces sp. NPDC007808 TaxID=3364779 RepID=UPI00367956E2
MTWPAASPVAALRVLRTAAGRRALQAALLVGGLFALAFLCGERAYAADRAPIDAGTVSSPASVSPASVSPTSLSSGAVGIEPALSEAGSAPHAVHDGESTAASVGDSVGVAPRPVTERVVEPVVEPVGGLVESVVDSVVEGAHEAPPVPSLPGFDAPNPPGFPGLPTIPDLPDGPGLPTIPDLPDGSDLPGLPDAPATPDLPSLPDTPGLPSTPGVPDLPSPPDTPGHTPPAPVTAAPRPEASVSAEDGGRADEGRSRAAVAVTHGPRYGAEPAVSRASARTDAHRTAPAADVPDHRVSADRPGVMGNRSAGDGGGSRHGDAHALSVTQRAPVRLLPGDAARADADEIRDRHRDIPVSPA